MDSSISGAQPSQAKINYFHAFNWSFFLWALLALIYFIVNSINVSCSGMRTYFIIWTASYAVEVLVPVCCGLAVRRGDYYSFCYFLVSVGILYKVIVVASLLLGAWDNVGICIIPYTFKLIIILANCIEALCLIILFSLLWRVKQLNRPLLFDVTRTIS